MEIPGLSGTSDVIVSEFTAAVESDELVPLPPQPATRNNAATKIELGRSFFIFVV
jgi:hypothetical protein